MKLLLIGLLLLSGFGCTNLQPAGPLSKHKKDAAPTEPADPDIPPPPAANSSAKLVPPAITIEPGDVNSENVSASIKKLTNEFDYDWKSLPPPSKTAEVSQYKNGVKVR
jgi:hypothetical protein